jgi:uncharacterized phage protein gp47/JayE
VFQIKDFLSVVASMVNYARAVTGKMTDYNVGSVARTMLEAPAAEIEELHQHLRIGLMEAIPVSVYRSFNFERLPAGKAQGVLVLTFAPRNADTVMLAGTRFSTDAAAHYVTLADLIIPAGETQLSLIVEAEQAGAVGNLAADVPLTPALSIAGFLGAEVGPTAITGGKPEATEPERKIRFNQFIRSLSRGTPEALRYGLSLAQVPRPGGGIERVISAAVEEMYRTDPNNPTGWVGCHISAGAAAPSSLLLARAVEVLHGYRNDLNIKVPGWKAAGVRTEVLAAVEYPAAFTCTVTPAEGYTQAEARGAVLAVLQDYAVGLEVGARLLQAQAYGRCIALPEVGNIRFTAPAGDINPGSYGKVTFGGVAFA